MFFDFFSHQLQEILPSPYPVRVAVGVSGGADSLGLTWLLAHWAQRNGVSLTALTVDHRLRDASRLEAQQVGYQMAAWGISHVTLPLESPPLQNLQERARQERYQAMALYCHQQNIPSLFLGHHQEDQLETWGMRLQAGSGLQGLSGMLPVTFFLGLRVLRPLLTWSPLFLKKILEMAEVSWIEDPSNHDERFQRTRFRNLLKTLDSTQRDFWHDKIQKLTQSRQAQEKMALLFLETHCQAEPQGYARLALKPFLQLSFILKHLVLTHILAGVGGHKRHPLAQRSLQNLILHLVQESPRNLTCGGCYIRVNQDDVWFVREWQRIKPILLELRSSQDLLWDRRFYIHLRSSLLRRKAILRPQGFSGARKQGLPFVATASLPALFFENTCLPLEDNPDVVLRWLGMPLFQQFN